MKDATRRQADNVISYLHGYLGEVEGCEYAAAFLEGHSEEILDQMDEDDYLEPEPEGGQHVEYKVVGLLGALDIGKRVSIKKTDETPLLEGVLTHVFHMEGRTSVEVAPGNSWGYDPMVMAEVTG